MTVFLGIDIGSTTVTAVAIETESRRLLASESAPNSAEVTSAEDRARGRSEWDSAAIADTALGVVKRLVERLHGRQVAAIGVTGQQQGCQLFDPKTLQPVGPLISWQDQRAKDPVDPSADDSDLYPGFEPTTYLKRMAELGKPHLVSIGPEGFAASGCPLVPGYTSSLIFWLQANGRLPPGVKASTVPEIFVSQLTGRPPVTDATDAAGWGVFDVFKSHWNWPLISDLGLSPSLFPDIAQSCTVAGRLLPDIAERCGVPAGTPVSVASGDHQCSFAGTVEDYDDTVAVNIGTGGQASVFLPDVSALESWNGIADYGSLELRPFIQRGYLLAGVGVVGGRSFRTLRDFFVRSGIAVFGTDADGEAVYSRLVELAAEAQPGAGGIRFAPFFTGLRAFPTNRLWLDGPEPDMSRRGEITGITAANFTPGNLARALFEGVAGQLRRSYEEAVELGAPERHILTGSGNGIRKNPVLRESLEADFRLPMRVTAHRDEAATGAALCAAVAAGEYESIEAASRSFVKYEE